jgi:hypothetical protein
MTLHSNTGTLLPSNLANALELIHRPLPEQSLGHENLSHADPSNIGESHMHWPVFLSQEPLFEHSAMLCAVSVAEAESA